jgi:TRAP-type C4-dicarboxylate transport system permease small subunit
MSHGLDTVERKAKAAPREGAALSLAEHILAKINYYIVIVSSIALVAAAFVLTYSVVTRYFLKYSSDWQDEMSVFLIVGAIFMSSAAVQFERGHVGIEALASILPPHVNYIRQILVDFASFLFCTFFAWKSWILLEEAWIDGFRSGSTWGPPLWIPYSLMMTGMILLSIQLLLQVIGALHRRSRAA